MSKNNNHKVLFPSKEKNYISNNLIENINHNYNSNNQQVIQGYNNFIHNNNPMNLGSTYNTNQVNYNVYGLKGHVEKEMFGIIHDVKENSHSPDNSSKGDRVSIKQTNNENLINNNKNSRNPKSVYNISKANTNVNNQKQHFVSLNKPVHQPQNEENHSKTKNKGTTIGYEESEDSIKKSFSPSVQKSINPQPPQNPIKSRNKDNQLSFDASNKSSSQNKDPANLTKELFANFNQNNKGKSRNENRNTFVKTNSNGYNSEKVNMQQLTGSYQKNQLLTQLIVNSKNNNKSTSQKKKILENSIKTQLMKKTEILQKNFNDNKVSKDHSPTQAKTKIIKNDHGPTGLLKSGIVNIGSSSVGKNENQYKKGKNILTNFKIITYK